MEEIFKKLLKIGKGGSSIQNDVREQERAIRKWIKLAGNLEKHYKYLEVVLEIKKKAFKREEKITKARKFSSS